MRYRSGRLILNLRDHLWIIPARVKIFSQHGSLQNKNNIKQTFFFLAHTIVSLFPSLHPPQADAAPAKDPRIDPLYTCTTHTHMWYNQRLSRPAVVDTATASAPAGPKPFLSLSPRGREIRIGRLCCCCVCVPCVDGVRLFVQQQHVTVIPRELNSIYWYR